MGFVVIAGFFEIATQNLTANNHHPLLITTIMYLSYSKLMRTNVYNLVHSREQYPINPAGQESPHCK